MALVVGGTSPGAHPFAKPRPGLQCLQGRSRPRRGAHSRSAPGAFRSGPVIRDVAPTPSNVPLCKGLIVSICRVSYKGSWGVLSCPCLFTWLGWAGLGIGRKTISR